MELESRRGRWVLRVLLLLVAIGFPLASPAALAADRVALVMGNSAYTAIGALPNPGNDATDVAAALGRLGFDVTTVRDADRFGMSEALRVFTRESAGADVSLVFYAGHGLEMDGVNYLVPVDAQLERDTDVRFEAVELDDVLAATTGAGLRVVILDACRNNPLARSMQRTGASRNVSRGSFGELDETLLGDETLVAYAAAAGTTAADGSGRNSPYTAALLKYMEQPLEIGLLFREVRARVLEATGGEQRPHEYASLLGEHYLRAATGADPRAVETALGLDRTDRRRIQQGLLEAGFSPGPADGVFGPATRAAIRTWQTSQGVPATGYLDTVGAAALGLEGATHAATTAAVTVPVARDPVPTAVRAQQENLFWESIRDSSSPAEIEAYIRQYPDGTFRVLATSRLAALRAAEEERRAEAERERRAEEERLRAEELVRRAGSAVRARRFGDLRLALQESNPAGAVVATVWPGGAADDARIQIDDIILSYNGVSITESQQLWMLAQATPPGTTVPIDVSRNGQRLSLETTVGSDDNPSNCNSWTALDRLPVNKRGTLEVAGDADCYRLDVRSQRRLRVETESDIDTFGLLVGPGVNESDDDGGSDLNFRIRERVTPGEYTVIVRGYNNSVTGNYTLRARLD